MTNGAASIRNPATPELQPEAHDPLTSARTSGLAVLRSGWKS